MSMQELKRLIEDNWNKILFLSKDYDLTVLESTDIESKECLVLILNGLLLYLPVY